MFSQVITHQNQPLDWNWGRLGVPTRGFKLLSFAGDGRSRRTKMLLAVIFVLSMLDLALTLGSMRITGMYEANPIVQELARSAHPMLAIAAFKLATVFICVGLLYAVRNRWQSELACWFLTAVLCVLAMHWVQYINCVALGGVGGAGGSLMMVNDSSWVHLG